MVNISEDINMGIKVVWVCLLIAFFGSIGLIFLMSCRCGAECSLLCFIVWITLILLLIAFIGVAAVTGWQCKQYKDRFETVPDLTTKAEDEVAMYCFGTVCAIFSLFSAAHLIFMCPCVCGTQINRAVKIMVAAAECFQDAWGLLFYPLLHNVSIIIAIACWIIGLVFMGTAGTIKVERGVNTLSYDETMQRALAYYLFMIIWIVEWMGAMGFMVMAGAILISFFDHKEEGGPLEAYKKHLSEKAAEKDAAAPAADGEEAKPTDEELEEALPESKQGCCPDRDWPLLGSFNLCINNHMGTAAIGSFFITLVVVIRAILTYMLEKAAKEDKTGTMKYIAACV